MIEALMSLLQNYLSKRQRHLKCVLNALGDAHKDVLHLCECGHHIGQLPLSHQSSHTWFEYQARRSNSIQRKIPDSMDCMTDIGSRHGPVMSFSLPPSPPPSQIKCLWIYVCVLFSFLALSGNKCTTGNFVKKFSHLFEACRIP